MMLCPRENQGSWAVPSRGWSCHVTALPVVAGSLHLPIRHETSEPSGAGWLNNSSPSLLHHLHTGDGETVTCVNSNPFHNTVCTPQAGSQDTPSPGISSLCLNSNTLCRSLSVCYCIGCSRFGHTASSSSPSYHPFLSLHRVCPVQQRAISAFRRKVALFILM